MFGMSFTEILIILVAALVLLGPEKLPDVAKALGKGMREFNKLKDGLTSTLEQEMYKHDEPPQILRARHLPTPPAAGPITAATEAEALTRLAAEGPSAAPSAASEPVDDKQLSLLPPPKV